MHGVAIDAWAPDIWKATRFVLENPISAARIGIGPSGKNESQSERTEKIVAAICREWLASQEDSLRRN